MPLLDGVAAPECRAVVVVPVRNEEERVAWALDGFTRQCEVHGGPLPFASFEILMLLNNCTDGSAVAAHGWRASHPEVRLHVIEMEIPPDCAHVGTARRVLMDTAWHRLDGGKRNGIRAILSTDSDSLVAADWIAQNLLALERGADAVGGWIELGPGEMEWLPEGAREAYARDQQYQGLVAELEDLLDPQAGDPWPRHLQHFGASLACTPEIYARAGGLPALSSLEDVAFVDGLRRVNARLRHEPAVRVATSSRSDGRVTVGLSGQLKFWQVMSERGEPHTVPSAEWLTHRFASLRGLRDRFLRRDRESSGAFPGVWTRRIAEARGRSQSIAEFLTEVDCDRMILETFCGDCLQEIGEACAQIAEAIERMRAGLLPVERLQEAELVRVETLAAGD